MLRKLLKYDFKSVLQYWWIAAVSSLVLALIGGGSIALLTSEKELPAPVTMTLILFLLFVIVGLSIFSVVAVILVFARFYRNFFTDEGYLTFTLPVKRSQLLNSKLIMSNTVMLLTYVMLIIDLLIIICIPLASDIFTQEFFDGLLEGWNYVVDELGFYIVIYILELLIFIVLAYTFSNLFLFCCITFASIITKKARVIVAIGIYYGANSVFSFVVQMFTMFGITSLASWLTDLPTSSENLVMALIFLGIILFMAVFCALLYTLQYWMLDRKLNLS